MRSKFRNIFSILQIYLLVLSIFSLFRIFLVISERNRINSAEDSLLDLLNAFFIGIRFDIVISSYILALPALLLVGMDLFYRKSKLLNSILFYWTFLLFSISFLIAAVDIPFFKQFFSRFSISAFEWLDNANIVAKMILEEPTYCFILLPFFIIVFFFFKKLKNIFNNIQLSEKTNRVSKSIVSLLFLFILFLGIRGRVELKSPIRIGTAYFSNNAFLNQLGLNPVFTLMRSYLDSKDERNKTIRFMDNQLAIESTRKFLNIKDQILNAPIARRINPEKIATNKPNVVLIIMESMSAQKMTRHGNKNKLTPFLDSLSYESLYFENIYTAGIHTFNGIFSTLYSFPALYRQQPLKDIKEYHGMSNVLLEHGYSTSYFTTHDGQFDNIEGFLYANGFQNIVDQSSYPTVEVKTALGVPDDYMFRFSLPILDDLDKTGNPFFVTYMTSSDHGPYFVPDYFKPKSTDPKRRAVEYADWSLRQFMEKASKKDWFNNTMFVFVADHGAPLSATYDISLDYHHTPLLVYAPEILDTLESHKGIGGQIDVFPTIMGLLKLPYVNNTLGVDLLKEERPYIYINGDDKIGVLDQEHLYILKEGIETKLYKYKSLDKTNYISQFPDKAKSMEDYAKSNMQVFQYLLLKNKLKLPESSQSYYSSHTVH